MSDTKEFDIIRIARSDGADTGPGYWPIPPSATSTTAKKPAKDASSEKTPRVKPQMARLSEDDPRFVEWRVKLGILLKQELSPNPDEGHPWYVQFPRGYWLYEKSKHLWVSGYPIKAKLFKTPQEFGLHLIWLLSASKAYQDCCCVHCNTATAAKLAADVDDMLVIKPFEAPPQPQPQSQSQSQQQVQPQSQPQLQPPPQPQQPSVLPPPAKPEKIPPKVTPVPLPTIPGQPSLRPTTAAARPSPSAKPTPTTQGPKIISPVPPPPIPAAATTSRVAQDPAPPIRPQPQPVNWTLQSPLLFRSGELVWYQNGNTWRLGVIATSNAGSYEVLPIGHGLVPQQNVTKRDQDMRPFHAFSVPPVSIPDLKDKGFDDIPWEAMLQATGSDAAKRDGLILDASKMAASKIDGSYSLWSPVAEDAKTKSITYYGCFFGSERIEVGDALRLKPLPTDPVLATMENAVLGLRQMFASKDFGGHVYFKGNVYQLVKGDGTSSKPAGVAVAEESLPVAIRDEMRWRNQVNAAQRWHWVLLKENLVVEEPSIRGRFYPTHGLMPILNQREFNAAVAQGQLQTQNPYLNSRMDGSSRYIGRKVNRIGILGAAVPRESALSLEPFIQEDSF